MKYNSERKKMTIKDIIFVIMDGHGEMILKLLKTFDNE